ncbi:hypothetical protein [Streptosporangium vulgare]|uniref:Major facilitator superfamily (MFS) profile domain-containing protein n=1 Tax=Streptosporangium vulgare TaxID=46190 RepID=A0ABV5TC72_9ACTN
MRAGYSEALAMLGYVLGMVVTPVLVEWARESGREPLAEVLLVCSLTFAIALLFGVVRLLVRGLRWGGRRFTPRRRTVAPERPSESPGHGP